MKLKTDFISNSSSTAFVVLIPSNFHIDIGDIEILWDNVDEEDNLSIEQIQTEVIDLIDVLKIGENVWCYGHDYTHPAIYDTIIKLCRKNKFILSIEDLNGEGNNMIQGIREEQVKDIIINSINMDETFNFLKKESEVVKKKLKDLH